MRAVFPVLIGLLLLGGCGPARGTLTGKVYYQDKLVRSGGVTVYGSDNIACYGPIDRDGQYKVDNILTGAVKICVVSPDPRKGGPARKVLLKPGETPSVNKKGLTPGEIEREKLDVDPIVLKEWFPIPSELGEPGRARPHTMGGGTNYHDIKLP